MFKSVGSLFVSLTEHLVTTPDGVKKQDLPFSTDPPPVKDKRLSLRNFPRLQIIENIPLLTLSRLSSFCFPLINLSPTTFL